MLLISDANIFIDLEKLGLLELFDELGLKIATSDFVYNEVNKRQKEIIDKLELDVLNLDDSEIGTFFEQFQALGKVKISVQDYSIFYMAKKYSGVVLSNDKKLRTFTKRKSVGVKGIFFILDKMVELDLVAEKTMVEKLILLKEINPRAEKNEIQKRVDLWG